MEDGVLERVDVRGLRRLVFVHSVVVRMMLGMEGAVVCGSEEEARSVYECLSAVLESSKN